MWAQIEPRVPAVPVDRSRGGRPRRPARECFDAIYFVLRTGCQWNALDETGLCPSSTAHDRFQEWIEAGFFEDLWDAGLLAYDAFRGIDWSFVCLDGAQTKAPLGGGENRAEPDRSGQVRGQAERGDRRPRGAAGRGDRRGQRARHVPDGDDAAEHRGPGGRSARAG